MDTIKINYIHLFWTCSTVLAVFCQLSCKLFWNYFVSIPKTDEICNSPLKISFIPTAPSGLEFSTLLSSAVEYWHSVSLNIVLRLLYFSANAFFFSDVVFEVWKHELYYLSLLLFFEYNWTLRLEKVPRISSQLNVSHMKTFCNT